MVVWIVLAGIIGAATIVAVVVLWGRQRANRRELDEVRDALRAVLETEVAKAQPLPEPPERYKGQRLWPVPVVVGAAWLVDQARQHPRLALLAAAGVVALAVTLPGIIGGGDGDEQLERVEPAPTTLPPPDSKPVPQDLDSTTRTTSEVEDPGTAPTPPSGPVPDEVTGDATTTIQGPLGAGATASPVTTTTPTREPEPATTAPQTTTTTSPEPIPKGPPASTPPGTIEPPANGNGDGDDDDDDEEAARRCVLGLDLRDVDVAGLLCDGLPV